MSPFQDIHRAETIAYVLGLVRELHRSETTRVAVYSQQSYAVALEHIARERAGRLEQLVCAIEAGLYDSLDAEAATTAIVAAAVDATTTQATTYDALGVAHVYDADAAAEIHFANDRVRIAQLAEAMYRQRTGRPAASWRRMDLDDQRPLRMEARNWLRAAVAAGLLPAPQPTEADIRARAWLDEQRGREIDAAVESTGHLPGWADVDPDTGRDYAEEADVRNAIREEEKAELAEEDGGVADWELALLALPDAEPKTPEEVELDNARTRTESEFDAAEEHYLAKVLGDDGQEFRALAEAEAAREVAEEAPLLVGHPSWKRKRLRDCTCDVNPAACCSDGVLPAESDGAL